MSGEPDQAAGLRWAEVTPHDRQPFDTNVAHSARVHDYWLGGKDHFAADRAAGDAVIAAYPGIVASVRANRAFLARVVRFLAAEAGIRQFLDIGTGIPAANNTHEVAQAAAQTAGWSTWTTTPSCSPTPGPCSPAPSRAPPTTSTRTCATRRRSWSRRPAPWTSPSRWPSC